MPAPICIHLALVGRDLLAISKDVKQLLNHLEEEHPTPAGVDPIDPIEFRRHLTTFHDQLVAQVEILVTYAQKVSDLEPSTS